LRVTARHTPEAKIEIYIKAFAITKMQKMSCLPLMPRQAVTFANHGKSNQKRFGERRQNHSAHVQCTATTISLKTVQNSPALKQLHRFAALRATARHTPEALCTPRGESADAGATQADRKPVAISSKRDSPRFGYYG
jgi:hypothetical protein